MRRKLVGLAVSIAWAIAMVCSVADPVTVYYKLSCNVYLEYLYYVPVIGLFLLMVIGWLVVRIAADQGLVVPLAAVAVSVATIARSLLASVDKDSWAVNWMYFGEGLTISLAVSTFLAVASIALPWWFWHRSRYKKMSMEETGHRRASD